MKNTIRNKFFRILIGISLLIPLIGIAGCWGDDDDDDYDSVITVCNRDNDEYTVKLHKASDGTVVDQFNLEEWYDAGDRCDDFNDYYGEFYITIHKDNAEDPRDTSSVFHIEEDEYEHFSINSDGEIVR
ncbi:MAG: hypothetical protein R6V76_07385 [Desulfobacterales bacterium]